MKKRLWLHLQLRVALALCRVLISLCLTARNLTSRLESSFLSMVTRRENLKLRLKLHHLEPRLHRDPHLHNKGQA